MSLSSLIALGRKDKPREDSFIEKPAVFAWTRTQIEIARRHGESPCSEIQHRVQEQLALARRYEDVHNEEDLEIEAAYKLLAELHERQELVVAGDIAEAVVFEGCVEEMRAKQLRQRSYVDSSASSGEGLSSSSSSSSSSEASCTPTQKRSRSPDIETAKICPAMDPSPKTRPKLDDEKEDERALGMLAAKELSSTWTQDKRPDMLEVD